MFKYLRVILALVVLAWASTGVDRDSWQLTFLFWHTGVVVDVPWMLVLLAGSPPARYGGALLLLAGVEKLYGYLRNHRGPRRLLSTETAEVLYLREFRSDEPVPDIRRPDWFSAELPNTFDQRICEHFSDAGRIAAVLPESGALVAPIGPDDIIAVDPQEDWHAAVARLLTNSRLVLLVLGTSEGLLWELTAALQRVPERLVLLAPAHGITPALWELTRARIAETGIEVSDQLPADTKVLVIRGGRVIAHAGEYALFDVPAIIRDVCRQAS